MNCPNCGAPLKLLEDKDYLTCEYCTYTYLPEKNPDGVRVLEEPADYSCPVCKVQMVKASLYGERVQYCPKCRGLLFPMGVFAGLVWTQRKNHNHLPPETPPPTNMKDMERKIHCPRCRQAMQTHPYGGPGNVIIDNCPNCLLNWLDYKEFRRITTAPDRSYKPEPWSEVLIPPVSDEAEEDEDKSPWDLS